ERGFCGTCGSLLFWRMRDAAPETATVSILVGSLDDASDLAKGYHICTEGRATFYGINDGLPQYAHDAPGLAING
ncbi:MAG: GFA family protein, partial [Paracoccaceae bacterium]